MAQRWWWLLVAAIGVLSRRKQYWEEKQKELSRFTEIVLYTIVWNLSQKNVTQLIFSATLLCYKISALCMPNPYLTSQANHSTGCQMTAFVIFFLQNCRFLFSVSVDVRAFLFVSDSSLPECVQEWAERAVELTLQAPVAPTLVLVKCSTWRASCSFSWREKGNFFNWNWEQKSTILGKKDNKNRHLATRRVVSLTGKI